MSDDLTGWDSDPEDHDDETLHADSIDSPRPSVNQLAVRTVDAVLSVLRRANRLAAGVLIIAGGVCVLGFLLGLAALDGGARTAWIVIGGAFALIAIGSVGLAMWRLSVVNRTSTGLIGEVRTLIDRDRESERAVFETVQMTEDSVDVGVVQVSRQYFGLRDVVSGRATTYPALSAALRAITGLPLALLLATLIALAFVPIILIFLLILIF